MKTIDYEFKRGDTTILEKFRPVDSDKKTLNLSPLDNIYFTMKRNEDGSAVLKKSIGNGITLGDDNFYHITMESTDTANLDKGTYKYDIEVVLNATPPYVKTIIEGEITLDGDITREGDRI